MPNTSRPRRLPRLRRLLALATDNGPARSYLAVLGASVVTMFVFPDSFVAAGPLLLTAPLSFLTMAVPFGPGTQGGTAIEVLAIGYWVVWLLLCAFVNAAVIGALATKSATVASPVVREPLPRSAGTRPQRILALLTPAFDNWLARGYLAVVAAAVGFFLYAAHLSPDPGFAAIWPLMATAPLSILAMLASLAAVPFEWDSPHAWVGSLVFSVGTVLAGLVNAVLLGRLARVLRAQLPRATA